MLLLLIIQLGGSMAVVGFGVPVRSRLWCSSFIKCLVSRLLWPLSLFVNDANALTSVGISVRIVQRAAHALQTCHEDLQWGIHWPGPQEPVLHLRGQENKNYWKCSNEGSSNCTDTYLPRKPLRDSPTSGRTLVSFIKAPVKEQIVSSKVSVLCTVGLMMYTF